MKDTVATRFMTINRSKILLENEVPNVVLLVLQASKIALRNRKRKDSRGEESNLTFIKTASASSEQVN